VIANAVQNSMNAGDNTLTVGLVAASTLVALNLLMDRYGRKLPFVSRMFIDEPTLLMQDGELLTDAMKHEHVDKADIEMAGREHGIGDLALVSEAILEPDGSISIIPKKGGKMHRSARRFRQLRRRA
ncbi:MAG TPA: YetF domain-containing protein, partial [Candidatus Limnocylindrales bacterium]|nr:YetF domain-containing protein [Candidatus Limnocylindrales bacterium]